MNPNLVQPRAALKETVSPNPPLKTINIASARLLESTDPAGKLGSGHANGLRNTPSPDRISFMQRVRLVAEGSQLSEASEVSPQEYAQVCLIIRVLDPTRRGLCDWTPP